MKQSSSFQALSFVVILAIGATGAIIHSKNHVMLALFGYP